MKYKKIVSFISAFSLAFTLLGTSVSAESSVTASDIKHLSSVIHGIATSEKSDDINNDGDIDVLDFVKLKNEYLYDNSQPTGEVTTADYSATAENVKLTGRIYSDKNDTAWLVQSGSAVEFIVNGTSAEVTIAGDSGINSEEKYKPRYGIYVDGELIEDALMSDAEKTIKLFDGTSPRKATVKIIHLSEANNGTIGVENISVTSSSAKPVVPVADKDLNIEFIGDSITCAYGVEGKSNSEAFSTSTENFTKSYAYLAAEKLNADYSAVCYSGHGIISGYTAGEKNTDSLVPDVYGLIGKPSDYAYDWDFEANPNDVVVINLGTNDYSYLSSDFEARSGEFVEGYVSFLKDIREKNPDAHIICTVGTMGGTEVYDLIAQAIDDFKAETGDSKVSGYLSSTQKASNGYGSDWHPSEITQQMSAYVLADKICEALGMESDKVGLDAVENGTYDVFVNSDNGANAAYYVGYDKSFWINMVSGGSQTSDIQAFISDIELKSGEYKLEFDYNSGVDVTVPLSLQDNENASEIYYSDELKSTTTTQHYSETFTVSKSDDNARLVFNLGGTDYYNMTFSNITLIKLS